MSETSGSVRRWYVGVGVGAAVAILLGTYAQVHEPAGKPLATFGFSGMINMKVWFTAVAMALAVGQVVMALRLYGRIGSGRPPAWLGPLHRTLGYAAILVSAPVAFHCLWSLGFSSFDLRTTVHSVAGCLVYGAFVVKVLSVRSSVTPPWALPWVGGSVFALLSVVFATSSVWFWTSVQFPGF